ARDEVLGIVSHDLRTPLQAISLCARPLAGHPPPPPAEVRELGAAIQRSTRWAQYIIRDLLDVTSIEAGRLAISMAPTSVDRVVEALRELFTAVASEQGVTLGFVRAEPLPASFQADPDRLVQALGNLLSNAIKFTPCGGQVTVAIEQLGGQLSFVVTDSGPGIAPEHLPHLFDRFWQARTKRRGSAGLGLAIARGIVEAHGGHIHVRSTVGQGSSLAVDLPASGVVSAAAPAAAPGPAARPRRTPRRPAGPAR
ncbi:MAG: sensor histidine kinase, partial [Gemmatimonadaceae bacterium]